MATLRREWPAWARLSDILDLIRLAVPIGVSRSSMMLMGLTDTIVLSRNAPEELPYILNGWFPLGITMGVSIGLLLGVSILTAEMSGRGERADTGRVFRRGLWTALLFGTVSTLVVFFGAQALFTLLGFKGELLSGTASATQILALGIIGHLVSHAAGSYLEALRRPAVVTIAMYGGVVFNLVLNLAFVGGLWGFPQLGADGVAIATSATRGILTVILLIFVAWFTPGFRSSAPSPKGEGHQQLKLGYGMAASGVAEWGSFNFTFIIATWVGLVAGTVYGMIIHTLGFIFMAFLGIGTATSVRVAEALGRGNIQQAADGGRLGIVTTIGVGALGSAVMFFGAQHIASIFVHSDETLREVALHPLLASMLMLTAVVVIFDGLQNVASMASRAMGSVWPPSFIHMGCYLGLMLPLAWLFGLHFERGLRGVVEGVITASFLAGVLQVIFFEWLVRHRKEPSVDLE